MLVRERVSYIVNVEILTGFLRLKRWVLPKSRSEVDSIYRKAKEIREQLDLSSKH